MQVYIHDVIVKVETDCNAVKLTIIYKKPLFMKKQKFNTMLVTLYANWEDTSYQDIQVNLNSSGKYAIVTFKVITNGGQKILTSDYRDLKQECDTYNRILSQWKAADRRKRVR